MRPLSSGIMSVTTAPVVSQYQHARALARRGERGVGSSATTSTMTASSSTLLDNAGALTTLDEPESAKVESQTTRSPSHPLLCSLRRLQNKSDCSVLHSASVPCQQVQPQMSSWTLTENLLRLHKHIHANPNATLEDSREYILAIGRNIDNKEWHPLLGTDHNQLGRAISEWRRLQLIGLYALRSAVL